MTTFPIGSDLKGFAAFAEALAEQSCRMMLAAINQRTSFATKSDESPVTEVDRSIEKTLRHSIAQAYPDHGILGEEFEPLGLDRDWIWVLDPIDGTKSYITGMPVYSSLIALTYRGIPIIGVMEFPATRERWVGIEGVGTSLNGRQVSTRPATDLKRCLLATGNPEAYTSEEEEGFMRLRDGTKWRIYGGSSYIYATLARGLVDIAVDSGLGPHDYCAIAPVVRNAGGTMTDWNGKPLTIDSGRQCVATGDPALHAHVLECLTSR
jgi:inositol-phosphate phosphatase/L-galactose 1-phosphate phosphatase/histidinol-phosphatase